MEAESNLLENKSLDNDKLQIKVCGRRWLILFIYMYYSCMNTFQWVEFPIIANIISKYYNVSAATVEWTGTIYPAIYIPFIIPLLYLSQKNGLRGLVLIGCLGTTLGAIIKVFALNQNLFWLILLAQGCLAIAQVAVITIMPRVTAVWFKENEVSTACSLAFIGNQFGLALGFVIPPSMVGNHSNVEDIRADLKLLYWGIAIAMIPLTLAVIFCFPSQPLNPPSFVQAQERRNRRNFTRTDFINSLKLLIVNGPFLIHVVAYGIDFGVLYAMGTFLNQFVLQYFPNGEEDAGRMGLALVLFGCLGALLLGIILDKTHKYKEATFITYLLSSVGTLGFMFALQMKSKLLAYIAIAVYGIFCTASVPAAFEFAVELTFPSQEVITAGFLMFSPQIFGIIFILMVHKLNAAYGAFWAIGTQAGLLALSALITAFISNDLRRQKAFREGKNISANCETPNNSKK